MDDSTQRRLGFAILAGITLALAAAFMVVAWPGLTSAASTQSRELARRGDEASGNQAITYYHLATWLDTENAEAHLKLARALLLAHQPEAALKHLEQAGDSLEGLELAVRTQLELGRPIAAAADATKLMSTSSQPAQQTLACLAYLQNNQSADCDALKARMTDPEALGRIGRAQTGKLPLAAELAATGLVNSSYAILQGLEPSLVRNLLMARIDYSRATTSSLASAESLLAEAAKLDPSSIEVRQLLIATYKAQNNEPAAAAQQQLVNKLISGRL